MGLTGITTSAIFLLVFISIVTTASLIVFWKWVEISSQQASENSCKIKQYNFCMEWRSKNYSISNKPNWAEISPKGEACAKFGIYEPDKSECEKIFK